MYLTILTDNTQMSISLPNIFRPDQSQLFQNTLSILQSQFFHPSNGSQVTKSHKSKVKCDYVWDGGNWVNGGKLLQLNSYPPGIGCVAAWVGLPGLAGQESRIVVVVGFSWLARHQQFIRWKKTWPVCNKDQNKSYNITQNTNISTKISISN